MLDMFKKKSLSDIPLVSLENLKKKIKIVVIDDEKNSFPVGSMQDFGFTVEYWDKINIHKYTRLENNEFDIIILDINGIVDIESLGSKDGLDILKSLKGKNPKQIVVAFSGSTYDISKGEFWKLADSFLKKPINVLDTKEMIETIILNNFSNEQLIKQLESIIKSQITDETNAKKLENLIVRSITNQKSLDIVKIVKTGIADTSGIITITTVLSDVYNRMSSE